jgi:hypothetical protein
MSAWRDIVRGFLGLGAKTDKGTVAGGSYGRMGGKKEIPSFKKQGEYYLADVDIKASIDGFSIMLVGSDFHFIHHADLPIEKRPEQDDDAEEAIRILNKWRRTSGFNSWLLSSTIDLWGFGNIIGEYIEPGNFRRLARIPAMTIDRFKVSNKGEIQALTQRIEDYTTYWEGEDLNRLFHMAWNPFDTGVIGRGVLYSLCRSGVGYSYRKSGSDEYLTEYRPPVAAIKEENDHAMVKAAHQYNPKHLILGTGIPDRIGTDLANKIQSARQEDYIIATMPEGARKGTNEAKIQVEKLHTESRSEIHPIVKRFDDQIVKGTETPYLNLVFGDERYSEASTRTAERFSSPLINTVQQTYSFQLEHKVFWLVLLEAGYDLESIDEMGIHMIWNPTQRIEITLEGLRGLGQANFLGRDEIRRVLGTMGGIELSKEPEYMGIQGGATMVGGEAVSSGARGYEKGKAPSTLGEGEEEAKARM